MAAGQAPRGPRDNKRLLLFRFWSSQDEQVAQGKSGAPGRRRVLPE